MSQSLAEWLWWRFGRGHRGAQARWDLVSQIDKTYWEHEARAVRWAVEGGVTEEALVEWQCPACGATTRARMSDHPAQALTHGQRIAHAWRTGEVLSDDKPADAVPPTDQSGEQTLKRVADYLAPRERYTEGEDYSRGRNRVIDDLRRIMQGEDASPLGEAP